MTIGRLTITWAKKARRDWQAQMDDLRTEQRQHQEQLLALSKSHFKLLTKTLNQGIGHNVGLGFQIPDDGIPPTGCAI
jgi:hypothetical protein